MAKLRNGINGEITGKVGSVIGSHWRGISYIRSVSNKKKRVSSPAQLQQQARFSLLASFLHIFKSLLSISFSKYTMRMTGSNEALSFNLLHGIKGNYPNLELNYPEILLSCGSLKGAHNAMAKAGEAGAVDFSWVNVEEDFPANGSDCVILVIYNPSTKLGFQTLQGALRESGTASITIDDNRGCTVETWLAFMSGNAKCFSDSIYTGTVITT